MSSHVTTTTIPDPKNPNHRARAHKLRAAVRRGQTLAEDDAAWLNDYEAAQTTKAGEPKFASGHRVFHMEESATDASGDAAAVAASAPAVSRNEGRRLDYILDLMLRSQMNVATMWERMAGQMIQRNAQLEEVHLAMLDAVREHYLARIEAEAENTLLKPEEKPDMIEEMARGMMGALAERQGVKMPKGGE